MPQRGHLRRLDIVWVKNPLYFVTVCCAKRRPILAHDSLAKIMISAWRESTRLYGWTVGRYVIMPDHVHFFARPQSNAMPLSFFMRNWKRWTANQIAKQTAISLPLWQSEFFDHVIRSADSYTEKWRFVRENPVRVGLVAISSTWPYSGEINLLQF